jgi:Family of unknown function (DUF6308)
VCVSVTCSPLGCKTSAMCQFDLNEPDPLVTNALARLQAALATPNLCKAVGRYFESDSSFAGRTFDAHGDSDALGDNPPDKITPDDLLAVTLLDVSWTPRAVRALLCDQADEVNEKLRAISTSTTFWDDSSQGCDELAKVDELWRVVDDFDWVGETKTSKLLARKRPWLVPITDSIIISAVGNSGKTWLTLRHCFKQETFREAVKSLRPPGLGDVSLLRIFDVAIWMLCSDSRAAREVRNYAEVTRNSCYCKPVRQTGG